MSAARIDHPIFLAGRVVRLGPLSPEHVAELMKISRATPEIFRYTSTPVTSEQADFYFATAFAEREAGRAYPFSVFLQETGEIVGSSRFADIRWQHRNCELGYTWFRPDLHGTGVNVESKLLMLEMAFERLGFLRVQIHTDARNEKSQRAIEALGAVYEGTLRRHMVAKEGFVRDTMVYSVVDQDWPEVRDNLVRRLNKQLRGAH